VAPYFTGGEMKVSVAEYEGCFGFTFTAESMEDAINITRIGVNGTKVLKYIASDVSAFDHRYDTVNDKNFLMFITIGKRKRPDSRIGGRK
jgi:hypothetical protein